MLTALKPEEEPAGKFTIYSWPIRILQSARGYPFSPGKSVVFCETTSAVMYPASIDFPAIVVVNCAATCGGALTLPFRLVHPVEPIKRSYKLQEKTSCAERR